MTKPITAIAVMMLYEEGRFDLNDEVGRVDRVAARTASLGRGDGGDARDRARDEPGPRAPPPHAHERAHLRLSAPPSRSTRSTASGATTSAYAPGADLAEACRRLVPRAPLRLRARVRTSTTRSPFDVLGRLIEIWSGQPLDVIHEGADLRSARHGRHRVVVPAGEGRATRHALRALSAASRHPFEELAKTVLAPAALPRRAAADCSRRPTTTTDSCRCCCAAASSTGCACCRAERSSS